MTSPKIVWRCENCHEPIADGEGHLELVSSHLRRYEREEKEWHDRIGPNRVIDLETLMAFPEQVHWRIIHHRCDPDPEADSYWISVERCRTVEQLILWTAHLLGKDWIQSTDWREVIRRADA